MTATKTIKLVGLVLATLNAAAAVGCLAWFVYGNQPLAILPCLSCTFWAAQTAATV